MQKELSEHEAKINPQLLKIIEAFEEHWGDEEAKEKVLADLSTYMQSSPDFNAELVDLMEQANLDLDHADDWMFSLIDALRFNPWENKNHLVAMFKHMAGRASQNHEDDLYIYFLTNDEEFGLFIKQVPETTREIFPLLPGLIRVNEYLHKKVAIQTAQYCLQADPLSDRVNFTLQLQACLHDADWRVRHYAYKCLKETGNLPQGYKRPFMDRLRLMFFHKKL